MRMFVAEFTGVHTYRRLMRKGEALTSNQAIKIHCILRGNENVCCGVHIHRRLMRNGEAFTSS
jgi:hypothetical protein